MIALVIIPCLYLALMDVGRWLGAGSGEVAAESLPAATTSAPAS